MTVLITLTAAGLDTGHFNLYSDINGFTSSFESAVSRDDLLAGYSSDLVPDFTTVIKIKSNGLCTNFIDVPVDPLPITTTTTIEETTTTTTTVA